MKSLRGFFLLLLTLPLLGGDEQTGEGGVWILPTFVHLTTGWHGILQQHVSTARSHVAFEDLEDDIEMRLPEGMGSTMGSLHVPATGHVYGLSVEGSVVTIPLGLLIELGQANVHRAEVLLLDNDGRGLPILLLLEPGTRNVDGYAF